MTATSKFSQFTQGINNYQYPLTTDTTVGLRGGINQKMSLGAMTDSGGSLIFTYGLASAYGMTFNGTGAIALPVGTTGQRPATAKGAIRLNTTSGFFEVSADGSTWVNLAAGGGGITTINGTANQVDVATVGATSTISLDSAIILPGTLTTANTVTLSGLTASTVLGLDSSKNIKSITSANSAILYTNSSGIPAWSASLTNGQLMIGSVGASPAPATLTAGNGIVITNGANSITIATTGLEPWVDQTTTPVTMATNTGYSANNAGLVTLNIPATVAFGTTFAVVGQGAGGWLIQANTGQTIKLGASVTSTAGSLSSTNANDAVTILCTVANTTFVAIHSIGNITIT